MTSDPDFSWTDLEGLFRAKNLMLARRAYARQRGRELGRACDVTIEDGIRLLILVRARLHDDAWRNERSRLFARWAGSAKGPHKALHKLFSGAARAWMNEESMTAWLDSDAIGGDPIPVESAPLEHAEPVDLSAIQAEFLTGIHDAVKVRRMR